MIRLVHTFCRSTHCIALILLLAAQASHAAERMKKPSSFEGWIAVDVKQNLPHALQASVGLENRFTDQGAAEFELTPELIWRYSPRWDFSVGAKIEGNYVPEAEGKSYVGLLSATYKLPIKYWNLSSRQRVELGIEEDAFFARFRQLNRVEYRGPGRPFRVVPYLSDEWYFDLNTAGLNENRVQLGLMYPFNNHTAIELYGMRLDRWPEEEAASAAIVFGINLLWNF